jgi:2-amino-4-hydroxy-6-hydroxymethyldihydropteridine diphosphokinase|tara:strand:+ start:7050 stop:7559 length:510 start_codon:yes stop_codon:yes gene_type:complete
VPVLSLSLGSNIDAASNIRKAVAALRAEFDNLRCSTVYESEALGFSGDNFLNLVVVAETDKRLAAVLVYFKQLEDSLGRDRSQQGFSPRTIDLDILTYSDEHGEHTGSDCGIVLPRPEITSNAFVLRPLAELLPAQIHIGTGVSFSHLWADFDKPSQRLWPALFDWSGQ